MRARSRNDTIVALASAPGRAALALIRMSGPESPRLIAETFSRFSDLQPRRLTLGRFHHRGEAIDQVMVAWFPAPHSYTGEELYEISCHGSPILQNRVIEALLSRGARVADPGEFTLRGFLNGNMDLTQAEAVRDLIESQTAFQAKTAALQLEGSLSRWLQGCKQALIFAASHLETRLEFVEDEVAPESLEALRLRLAEVAGELRRLTERFRFGRQVSEGVQIAIVGKPNAGKSSLFNAFLRDDRAIVTAVPGTTRDTLAERVDLGGLSARLLDTAGLRETRDEVELLGVERTRRALAEVDAAILVLDGSQAYERADGEVWAAIRGLPVVVAVNKQDLTQRIELPRALSTEASAVVGVTAISGKGIEALSEAVRLACTGGEAGAGESVLVTNQRHQRCILDALDALAAADEALAGGASEEFAVADVRRALAALGEITGEVTVEDILGEIFSTFCIGK